MDRALSRATSATRARRNTGRTDCKQKLSKSWKIYSNELGNHSLFPALDVRADHLVRKLPEKGGQETLPFEKQKVTLCSFPCSSPSKISNEGPDPVPSGAHGITSFAFDTFWLSI